MDFLDGVLNEGGSSVASTWDELASYDAAPPAAAAAMTTLQSVLSGGSAGMIVSEEDDSNNNSLSGLVPPLVSANPWASEPLPTALPSEPALGMPRGAAAASAASAATDRQSRLSARYGISIEDVSERSATNGIATSGDGGGNNNNHPAVLAADVLDGEDALLLDLFPPIAEADEPHPSSSAGAVLLQGEPIFPTEDMEGEEIGAPGGNDRDPEVSFLSDTFG
jgi:hypothetical protein